MFTDEGHCLLLKKHLVALFRQALETFQIKRQTDLNAMKQFNENYLRKLQYCGTKTRYY